MVKEPENNSITFEPVIIQPPPRNVDEEEDLSDSERRKRSISKKACEHCKKSHACCEGLFLKSLL